MKTLLTIVICTLMFSSQAQTFTEKYLKMIPSLPKDTCNITHAGIDNFKQLVSDLSIQVQTTKDSLNNITESNVANSEETAKAHAMQQMSQQYGLSPEQMQKMQSGKMSAAEKQALANQVLQQQTNMSMSEVQNLSKMSDAGKKAYMEAYGTEMAAAGQTAQSQQNASNAKNLNELIAQQQALNSKINSVVKKIADLYSVIQNDPELIKSYNNIEKWHNKLMSMSGVDAGQGKQMDSLGVLIKNEQIKICNKYTPRLRSALKQDLPLTKSIIPDTYQLVKVTSEITFMQSGVQVPSEGKEVPALGLIASYLDRLQGAYNYKLYFPEDN